MPVRTTTAEDLVEEVFLFGRVLRGVLLADDEAGLPPALLGVLNQLAGGGPRRQGDLAGSLCVSQSALSRQITELFDAGYVERRPDPADGRAYLVQVSESGRQLLAAVRADRAGRLKNLLDTWSQDEADAALASLRLLKNTFVNPTARHSVTESETQRGDLRP
ncbi:MarR family winged helix-turn-helix transcriptional regulator [Rhodococcus kronopolitis]|uniref:MarR family winged helix-turn-helix transcriptional regulator n=1 Tax=Rhodococcus kronopolitis TaxID=1460226 RepID=A0ABV9FNL3_9NOCA